MAFCADMLASISPVVNNRMTAAAHEIYYFMFWPPIGKRVELATVDTTTKALLNVKVQIYFCTLNTNCFFFPYGNKLI